MMMYIYIACILFLGIVAFYIIGHILIRRINDNDDSDKDLTLIKEQLSEVIPKLNKMFESFTPLLESYDEDHSEENDKKYDAKIDRLILGNNYNENAGSSFDLPETF